MLRHACCMLAFAAGLAVAAPCDAPPEVVSAPARDCAREVAALEAKMAELLGRVTELHPDARAARRDLEERRQQCATPAGDAAAPAPAEIAIDAALPRQALHGFGATWPWSALNEPRITDSHWRRAIPILVSDIGALTGAGPPILEPQGSNAGRGVEGFSRPLDFAGTDRLFQLYGREAPGGIADVFPFANINVRWSHPWMKALRAENYRVYLEEVASKAVAAAADWRARTGREPEYLQLWNEPITGNGELGGGTAAEIVDTLRAASRRLRQAGFERVRFVVPAEETVRETLNVMRAIGADGEALGSVGAISYHVYPYGSDYTYLPRLLATRARGLDFDASVTDRLELRRLSELLRVPVWMTEVSNGYARQGPNGPRDTSAPDSIDWVLGRAIHIHDELRHAGASAFFGMMAVWSDALERDQRPGVAAQRLKSEGDHLVLVDVAGDSVKASGMGHAIGHYGRWLKRGARYLDSKSSSRLVLVSPFRDGDRLVAVLVNMARAPVATTLRLSGAELAGPASLERTRTGACRERLDPIEPREGALELELAPWSVTTLAAPLR